VNILLITIDSLRFDRLGCYGNDKSITPNIDKFSDNALIFLNAFSNGPYTRSSIPSLLSSTYSSNYPDGFFRCPSEARIIPQILKEHNYITVCFQTNPFLFSEFGYNKGFEYYEESISPFLRFSKSNNKNRSNSISDYFFKLAKKFIFYSYFGKATAPCNIVNKKILSFLSKYYDKKKNYFLWIHYMDTHEPYVAPAEFIRKFTKNVKINIRKLCDKAHSSPNNISSSEKEILCAYYDASINFLDDEFGKLVNNSQMRYFLENCLVIITSDHGDEFFEHGGYGHSPRFYDELLHVPLILKHPDFSLGKEIEDIVSLIDIFPTIMQFIGITNINCNIKGKELTSQKENDTTYVISEALKESKYLIFSIRTKSHKFIISDQGNELYDLNNDPKEVINIYGKNNVISKRFEDIIEDHLKQASQSFEFPESIINIDDSIKDRLRDLGYID